eukprot:4950787-Lingulodinium_polyedra.AAC.1
MVKSLPCAGGSCRVRSHCTGVEENAEMYGGVPCLYEKAPVGGRIHVAVRSVARGACPPARAHA